MNDCNLTSSPSLAAEGGSASVRLARLIATDIMQQGVPTGALLGSQRELVERYRTSLPTLSQAARSLEDDGIAMMRPGRGGGLVVTAPPSLSAVRAMHLYLVGQRIGREQLAEASEVVDTAMIDRAFACFSREDLQALEALAGAEGEPAARIVDIERAISSAARQPVLALFAQVLDLLAREEDERSAAVASVELGLRRELALAVIGGERRKAIDLMRRRRRWADSAAETSQRTPRRSEELARKIEAQIRRDGLAAGARLGLERELQEQFSTSRLTLRGALRLLERAGRVVTIQGRRGGVFVGDSRPDAAIDMVALYLTSIQLRFSQQVEARAALEARAAALAASRIRPEQATALRRALERERIAAAEISPDWDQRGRDVEHIVVEGCNNPVLSFFTRILIDLSMHQAHWREIQIAPEEMARQVSDIHQAIAEHVLAGRSEHAAREILLFCQTLTAWVPDAQSLSRSDGPSELAR